MINPPEELLNFFKKEDRFVLATHESPDGDGLGSAIALSMALRNRGKKTVLICKDAIAEQYWFLPGQEEFMTLQQFMLNISEYSDYNNLVLIDCNNIKRIADESRTSDLKFKTTAVIDHHETKSDFGDIRWIIPDSPATGLMVFEIINQLGMSLSEDMAVNLYAAIAVDTGNFSYENTNADVLRIASELAAAGARPHAIHRELFESWSKGRFSLFMKVINTMQIQDGVSIVRIDQKMFEETSTSEADTENFVEFPRIMKGIKVSVLFREIEDGYFKLSLRSKGNINVAKIAGEFGGGGHKNAAGCKIRADFETAKREMLKKLLIAISMEQ